MTEEQQKRGDKIAAGAMRALAVTGLVAVLALGAWLIVQGLQKIPAAEGGLSAAVSAIQSVFRGAPDTELSFSLTARTFATNEQITIAWEFVGEEEPESYGFSYSCADQVLLSIKSDMGWTDQNCDTPFVTAARSVQVIPNSPAKRFTDIELLIEAGDLNDSTLVTIVNKQASLLAETTEDGADSEGVGTDTTVDEETSLNNSEDTVPVTTTTPTPSQVVTIPAQTVVQPLVTTGPSDLRINIDETGILLEVAGKDTFFVVSPIPVNKTAAVRFTVTNRGGEASGAWAFVAKLPIEGDDEYRYVSPAQASLAPNTLVEFTLGFDELLDESTGRITIELVPTKSDDTSSNNTDAVKIDIEQG